MVLIALSDILSGYVVEKVNFLSTENSRSKAGV